MSRLPQAFLDELFQRVSISDVVGSRVVWDKRKSSFPRGDLWACCPFHSEKTPSFHVEEAKGFYHCFGCQESGNAVDFLMKLDGLSFPEAAEQLAARVGLAMPERVREDPEETSRRKGAVEAIAAAARWFADQLRGSRGAAARAYLGRRGLPEGEWARFGLGYAPDSRDGLKAHLEAQGFDVPLQVEAGLLAVADDGRAPYDRFRDRLMFPITDARGQIIAFGGRALRADAMAKYLNSPETSLFHKGRRPRPRRPARGGRRLHGRDCAGTGRHRRGRPARHGHDRGPDRPRLEDRGRTDPVLRRRQGRPGRRLPGAGTRAAAGLGRPVPALRFHAGRAGPGRRVA
jgi:DNA primase